MVTSPGTQTALVVAHPGHEVRVHGWLEMVHPEVFILTDGSGATGQSRLSATTTLLAECGARRGRIYGRLTDLETYRAILNRNFDVFEQLVCELAHAFASHGVECVTGDASEGYNSVHDLCRILIDVAVSMSSRASGRQIANFDFPVVGRPEACAEDLLPDAICLRLEPDAFARKLQAAAKYYPELLDEVASTLNGDERGVYRKYLDHIGKTDPSIQAMTLDSFRTEFLRPVRSGSKSKEFSAGKPFYEIHGERQVAAGRYSEVIRYGEHMKPLAEALWNYAEIKQISRPDSVFRSMSQSSVSRNHKC